VLRAEVVCSASNERLATRSAHAPFISSEAHSII
jgi:hypothetical protein